MGQLSTTLIGVMSRNETLIEGQLYRAIHEIAGLQGVRHREPYHKWQSTLICCHRTGNGFVLQKSPFTTGLAGCGRFTTISYYH